MLSIIKEIEKKSTQTKNKKTNWLNSQLKQARMRQNFVQDPSQQNNRIIIQCYSHGSYEAALVLFQDIRIRKSLKSDYEYLYNELLKLEIKTKLIHFN